MDLLSNLSIGLTTVFTPDNLAYAFLGCLLGTLIGVLPGLGPLATIAMLLPMTYNLAPDSALIMLAGIIMAPSMVVRPLRSSSICLASPHQS